MDSKVLFLIDKEYFGSYEEDLIKQFCEKCSGFEWKVCDVSEVKNIYMRNEFINDSVYAATIPVGSVNFCLEVYGDIVPEYYPVFLRGYLNRCVWREKFGNLKRRGIRAFIKPSWRYKAFDGGLCNEVHIDNENMKVWCSQIVEFDNEWRYYVADGCVIEAYWYDGNISDEELLRTGVLFEAPKLDDVLLEKMRVMKWCGVIDMGMMRVNGEEMVLSLVEACHPFAVGWYPGSLDNGDEFEYAKMYVKFLMSGHRYMQRIIKGKGKIIS